MARIRQTKSEDLVKAKKALLRKVTFMKLVQTAQAVALVVIALKYLDLIHPIVELIRVYFSL